MLVYQRVSWIIHEWDDWDVGSFGWGFFSFMDCKIPDMGSWIEESHHVIAMSLPCHCHVRMCPMKPWVRNHQSIGWEPDNYGDIHKPSTIPEMSHSVCSSKSSKHQAVALWLGWRHFVSNFCNKPGNWKHLIIPVRVCPAWPGRGAPRLQSW